jgi:hypothetical protein
MDETLAKTLKLPIDGEISFGVRVANGQVIRTLSECKEVKFKMQGLHLKLTFNLLGLGGYGIVLGTQWLSTLGMINWDFKNLMMGFMHEGNKVWLQGLKEKPNLIQGSKDFKGKATMKGLLFPIMPCELASIQEEIDAPIRELVEEFPQVLEEPEGLPPKRNHEDQILLKHETSKPAGLLQPLGIPPRSWHSISMDFVEGLPTSSKQNVILVSVDRFTKYVHFIPPSHPYTVSRVAFLFLQHMFKLHGLSSSIVSESRDGNGADRDRIMGDPNPPRTCTTNTRPRPAPVVGATYPAPLPNRPAPPRGINYAILLKAQDSQDGKRESLNSQGKRVKK